MSYILVTLLLIFGIVEIIKFKSTPSSIQKIDTDAFSYFIEIFIHNFTHPLAIFMLQILVVLITSRIFGFILKRIHQPSVVGKIIAGITLGPSILGLFFPDFFAFLFPAQSLSAIQFLSQIGLILFMFVVGLEINLSVIFKKANEAIIISHFSILIPFFLGTLLACYLYDFYAPKDIPFSSFALFIGIAMSITAFPVLARIVKEHKLSKTPLGNIVLTSAAIDDITAWIILATIIAIVKAGSGASVLFNILLSISYVALMFILIKPLLEKYTSEKYSSPHIATVIFFTLLSSAYIAEIIGIHALFGAFIAGVVTPNTHRLSFTHKVEDVSIIFLLPLFFVYTGLRTHLNFLGDINFILVSLAVISLAVIGKLFGAALTAKWVGYSWKESFMIGSLMNTRGLMELVVLNIGYDLGILSQELFSIMVVMAIVTTFMTGPLLYLLRKIS